jgi:hypothetical protein
LKLKFEDIKVIKNQLILMNDEDKKKINEDYIIELKELAKVILKVFD